MDHSGYVSSLKPDIPVTSSPMESEVCYAVPRVSADGAISTARGCESMQRSFLLMGSNTSLSQEALAFWNGSFATRQLQARPPGACTSVGNLRVCGYPVDHSIFGAMAYGVETSEGWVIYTGDLRVHGRHGHHTKSFAEAAGALKPLALIAEGTHVEKQKTATEDRASSGAPDAMIHDSGRRGAVRRRRRRIR